MAAAAFAAVPVLTAEAAEAAEAVATIGSRLWGAGNALYRGIGSFIANFDIVAEPGGAAWTTATMQGARVGAQGAARAASLAALGDRFLNFLRGRTEAPGRYNYGDYNRVSSHEGTVTHGEAVESASLEGWINRNVGQNRNVPAAAEASRQSNLLSGNLPKPPNSTTMLPPPRSSHPANPLGTPPRYVEPPLWRQTLDAMRARFESQGDSPQAAYVPYVEGSPQAAYGRDMLLAFRALTRTAREEYAVHITQDTPEATEATSVAHLLQNTTSSGAGASSSGAGASSSGINPESAATAIATAFRNRLQQTVHGAESAVEALGNRLNTTHPDNVNAADFAARASQVQADAAAARQYAGVSDEAYHAAFTHLGEMITAREGAVDITNSESLYLRLRLIETELEDAIARRNVALSEGRVEASLSLESWLRDTPGQFNEAVDAMDDVDRRIQELERLYRQHPEIASGRFNTSQETLNNEVARNNVEKAEEAEEAVNIVMPPRAEAGGATAVRRLPPRLRPGWRHGDQHGNYHYHRLPHHHDAPQPPTLGESAGVYYRRIFGRRPDTNYRRLPPEYSGPRRRRPGWNDGQQPRSRNRYRHRPAIAGGAAIAGGFFLGGGNGGGGNNGGGDPDDPFNDADGPDSHIGARLPSSVSSTFTHSMQNPRRHRIDRHRIEALDYDPFYDNFVNSITSADVAMVKSITQLTHPHMVAGRA